MRTGSIVAIAISVAALTGSAFAQTKPVPTPGAEDEAAKKQARDHFQKGLKLHDAKKYDDALKELETSLELYDSPNTVLLIAHCHRNLDHKIVALRAYDQVIRDSGAKVRDGEDRYKATLEEAGRWAAVLKTQLGEVVVSVRTPPDGATILVNGEGTDADVDESGNLVARAYTEPGTTTVALEVGGATTEQRDVELAAGQSEQVSFDLTPAPVAAAPPTAPPPERNIDAWPPPIPSIIAGGVGVAGFAVFGVFGMMSQSTASDLDECRPSCDRSLQEDADRGKRDQLIANIGLIVGGVGLAAGAGYWVYTIVAGDPLADDDADADADARRDRFVGVRVSPSSLDLVGRF